MTTETIEIGWKFLYAGMRSAYGDDIWTIGGWQPRLENISICKRGYHMSPDPLAALGYICGTILTRCEACGTCEREPDKSCHAEMRVIEAWHWTKRDSVALAVFAAELVINIFEQRYPSDRRPREAIEIAKRRLEIDPAADAAADPAADPAADAAAGAGAAARAAYAAAAAAGATTIRKQIVDWMIARTAELQHVEG